ncbi:MAG TPA: hypothetical protein VFP61_08505 [Acidimicrobiales bacterium]|nr:hypothetical protein [Acidimicrobiales bacterium]
MPSAPRLPSTPDTRHMRAAAGTLVLAACLAACGSSPRHAALGYRTLPAFLPARTAPVDRVVTATASHPQLAAQGIAVDVDLAAGHVQAVVTGPAVPPFVAPPPPAVTATWTVTLTDASGFVPVHVADFTVTDQLGRTFTPSLVEGAAPPPATAARGGTVTFRLTAVMPTGEGRLHWSPGGGPALVSWDFVVEDD